MKEKDIQKELETISPLLAKVKREQSSGMKVPKNYFNNLPLEIMEKVATDPKVVTATSKSGGWREWLRQFLQPKPIMAMATVLLLIIGIGWWNADSNPNIPSTELALSDITTEELESWALENTRELSLDIISTVAEDIDVETLSFPESSEDEDWLDDILDDVEVEDLL